MGNFLVTLALFLNPFGYDLIVYWINSITNNYWMTMSIMYSLAIFFFGLFMYFYNINPIESFKFHSTETRNNLKRKLKRRNGKI